MLKPIIFDIETSIHKQETHGSSHKYKGNDIYTVIYGHNPEEITVEHRAQGFNRTPPPIFQNSDVIIGHNLSFDLSYIINTFQRFLTYKDGNTIWDTQYAEYLLSGQRHSMSSLGELQEIYLGNKVKEDKISSLYKRGIGADRIVAARNRCPRIWKLYEKYCRDDGATTLKIFKLQYLKAKQLGLLPIIQMYMKYLSALIVIQNTGINIDLETCEITNRDFKLRMLAHLQRANEIIAPYWSDERLPPFNVNSNDHKSAILFGGQIKVSVRRPDGHYKNGKEKTKLFEEVVEIKGFGLPTSLTTESKKKGVYCSDSVVVQKICTEAENEQARSYCAEQVAAMNLKKMCSTYLEAFLNLSIDGLLYPNFNHALTSTGRLSSSNPNLQNVPSKGDMGDEIQKQFIAPEGWVCVSCDYAQLEIYVLAWLSGDKALLNDLLSGVDMHIKRLAYAESMSYDEVYDLCKLQKAEGWDLKRSKAKTVSYQKAYGAGVKSLARTTGLDEEVVQKIFDQEDLDYPDVKRFNDNVRREVENNQQISLARHFPMAKKKGGVDGKAFRQGVELLPIYENNDRRYGDELRHFGSYRSHTGRLYTFEEIGRYYRGSVKRGYSPQQMMNYPMQGTASDIVASATAELGLYVLKYRDEVRMINTIHDSIWFYIKKDKLALHVPIITDIMSRCKLLPTPLPFEIPVDVKVSPNNFGYLESYEL